jgi:von Willebrand factor type A domain
MDQTPHSSAPIPERRLPAWALSLLFHATALVLLAMAVQDTPRGAAEEAGRQAGIVLKQSTADGELYQGEEALGEKQTGEQPSAAALVAALPADTAETDAASDLPQLPAIGPGASDRGGQPNAGQFTTGGGHAGSPTGGGARVRVFGVEGEGNKFVYVFDRSSSMEGLPLAAAKRQLVQSLDSLDSVHQFQIIFFNHTQQPFEVPSSGQRIAFATDRNKQLAANFVGGITADGGTDRFTALKMAVQLQPDVIFFLTDADDPMSASELAEIARLNRRANATICTIQFGRGPRQRENFLVDLANQTGGQYVYVDTTKL